MRTLYAGLATMSVLTIGFTSANNPVVESPRSELQPIPLTNPWAPPVGICGTCKICLAGHKLDDDVPFPDLSVYHDWCMALPSCAGHPACQGASAVVSPDWKLILDKAKVGDWTAVTQTLASSGARMHLNYSRSAIQVEGCSPQTMVAHIPIPSEDLEQVQLITREIVATAGVDQ